MNTPRPTKASGSDDATLGALLYADPGKRHPLESEWVALVRAVAAGDQAALHALYERAHRAVFTLVFRLSGDRGTAEELTVDVFHGVWQRAGTFDPAVGTVLAWIMNQARSRAIDRLRFDGRQKRRSPAAPSGAVEPLTADGDASEGVRLMELGRQLRGALTELTAAEREAIQAAYFSELTYAETAALLGVPLGTVKTRIRSGLAKLRLTLGGTRE